MIKELKSKLQKLKDEKYKAFSSSLLPNTKNVLGVRLPILRKIAKEIFQSDYKTFFTENDDEFFELTMLQGMVIGLIKDKNEALLEIKKFIPKIDNWSICDSFCSSLKIINNNKEETKKFLQNYFNSKKEFELRFCYVILLMYFIDSDFNYVIEKIKKYKENSYYSKMAVGWCLSICIIKNYKKTISIIQNDKFPKNILEIGIRKAIESTRLSKEEKLKLKNL